MSYRKPTKIADGVHISQYVPQAILIIKVGCGLGVETTMAKLVIGKYQRKDGGQTRIPFWSCKNPYLQPTKISI
ncbi:hypothetical protein B5J93_00880 [Moraxella equi]|uniref:Uncharacterized protein n=1 Tax=Moraxella equi TaxID=60442 RepID=A0ABX3NLE9_9GAMM|nr:hypothetical protein B5J93_00880 [Moraxella equi]